MFRGEIHFTNPGFLLRAPFFERETPGENFLREQARRRVARRVGQLRRRERQPAENAFPPRQHATLRGIERNGIATPESVRKIFL